MISPIIIVFSITSDYMSDTCFNVFLYPQPQVFWCPFVNDKYRLPHLVVWRVMTSPAGAGCSSWLVVGWSLCSVSKVQLLGRDTGDVRQRDSELSSSAVLWCCSGVSGPEHFQACKLLKRLCCTCSNTGTCSWCPTLQTSEAQSSKTSGSRTLFNLTAGVSEGRQH